MTQTYRSSPQYVTDGDTTSHTTPENINVKSAQIRWQGISGYPQSKTRPAENALKAYAEYVGNSGSITFSMPSRPSGTSYNSSRLVLGVSASDGNGVDIDIVAPDGTTLASDTLEDAHNDIYTWSNASTDGGNLTVNYSSDSGNFQLYAQYRETTGTYDTDGGNGHATTNNSESYSFSRDNDEFSVTLTPSFPSVPQEVLEHLVEFDFDGKPDGNWDCDFHADYNGDGTDDISGSVTFVETNGSDLRWGGYNEDVSYHIPTDAAGSDVEATLDIDTRYDTDGSVTVSAETRYVKVTKRPSVSGDVSATYRGAFNSRLDDGEWSNWRSMDAFSEGTNEFIHSIKQSGEANFQFEYTYEYLGPDAVAVVRVQHDDGVYDLTLADPSDSQLEHNNLRVNVNNETLAADLVDPSDQNATPVHVHVPNYGTLAWRKNL